MSTDTRILPSPQELGLPARYESWRENQDRAIMDGLESEKRFCAQVQRPGTGKTLTTFMQAYLSKQSRSVILTPNKNLQDDMMGQFGPMGLVDIRGKSSYECEGIPGRMCDDGQLAKCIYKGTSMCGHVAAVGAAKESRIVVSNYTCYISSYKYGRGFGKFDLMICDEAHAIADEVSKAMQIYISDRDMEAMHRDWPKERHNMTSWKKWAAVSLKVAQNAMDRNKLLIEKNGDPNPIVIKEYKHYQGLVRKLADLSTCRPEHWVADDAQYGFSFTPIDISRFIERALFRDIEKVIFTSGTLTPRNMEMNGLAAKDYEFHEYEVDTNPANSPLVLLRTGIRVNRNTQPWELKKLLVWIDEIIGGRLDRKGVIHTCNFKLRDWIMANSQYSEFMLSNYKSQGDVTSNVISRFKSMKPPTVMVSASIAQGVDLPYDDCRYQIIVKAPYTDMSGRVEMARNSLDKNRASANMMQSFAQMFSRGLRADNDYQEVFCVDANMIDFMWRFGDLAPKWLHAYVRVTDKVPAAKEIGHVAA